MRSALYILAAIFICSTLQAQEFARGSFNLKVDELRGRESSVQLILTGPSGTVLYQIKREMPYDTPRPLVHLFANGSVLLVDGFAGVYEWYGENGRMIDRIPLNEKISPNHERIVSIAGNDSITVLLTSEPGQAFSRIMLLNAQGKRTLDRPVGGTFASGLVLSPNGTSLAAGTYSWQGPALSFKTEFFKTDGNPISSIDREFKGGAWSPDGAFFAMYGRRDAIVIDVAKNEVLATTDLGENKVVHEISWDSSAPLIVCSPSPTFDSNGWLFSRLAVLNLSEGTTIYQSDMAFRNVRLEKGGAETSLKIDGRSVRLR